MVARGMATNPRGCPANTRREHARQGGCCYSRKMWPYEILTGGESIIKTHREFQETQEDSEQVQWPNVKGECLQLRQQTTNEQVDEDKISAALGLNFPPEWSVGILLISRFGMWVRHVANLTNDALSCFKIRLDEAAVPDNGLRVKISASPQDSLHRRHGLQARAVTGSLRASEVSCAGEAAMIRGSRSHTCSGRKRRICYFKRQRHRLQAAVTGSVRTVTASLLGPGIQGHTTDQRKKRNCYFRHRCHGLQARAVTVSVRLSEAARTRGSRSRAAGDHGGGCKQRQRRQVSEPRGGRASRPLGRLEVPPCHVLLTSTHGVQVECAHRLAVDLERRDAEVARAEVARRAVGERPLQEVVHPAVARKVVADDAQSLHSLDNHRPWSWSLQQVVPVQPHDPHPVRRPDREPLYRVDLVVEEVEAADLGEPIEGGGPHHAEVRLLYGEHVNVGEAPECVRLQGREVHEGELQQTYRVELAEGPGEGGRLDLDERVVVEQQQADVGRAGEGVTLDALYLVVGQEDGGDVLEAGEGELGDDGERGVLDGQLLEAGQAAEGERADCGDVVAVEGQLSQSPQAGEGVTLDGGEVVLGEREVLDSGRQQLHWDLRQPARVAQHLRQHTHTRPTSGQHLTCCFTSYRLFRVTSNLTKSLLKFCFQDIPLAYANKALPNSHVSRPPVTQSVGTPTIWDAGGSGFESRIWVARGGEWSSAGMLVPGGNGISQRKPAEQRHRPARFPHPGASPPGIEHGSPWVGGERPSHYATTAPPN
ncbi:hypothetical protein PR048_031137 [Dryococelus australis]|uniref:Uncharacterized protein n=1 Tax=Dryococelus australis TaxID=614101 RepID=A0ABQ9G4E2_9NEOP|nr:hypothetical protein PR048_031137 [Dryococelus australis]